MHQYDWYYRLKVLEDHLDTAFGSAEDADEAIVSDLGFGLDVSAPSEFGGISYGYEASNPTGLDVEITDGSGYDATGRRVHTGATRTIIVSHIGDVPIGDEGEATGATCTPVDGYERWVTVFISYDRLLSDPRYDGYNNEVYFSRAESFHFSVAQGVEKLNGTLTTGDKPARESGKLLLADVQIRTVGATTTVYALDQDRQELFFRVTATGAPAKTISRGRLRDVLKDLLELYNDHVGGTDDKHAASAITKTGGQQWADGTAGAFGVTTDLQAAMDGITTDLKATVDVAGAKRIGAQTQLGTLSAPYYTTAAYLIAGTLESQLTQLLAAVNGRVFRGGDRGLHVLVPAEDGEYLGSADYSWDAYVRDLYVKGSAMSNIVPGDPSFTLGSVPSPWGTMYANDVHSANATIASAAITELVVTQAASASQRWMPYGFVAQAHTFFDDFFYVGDDNGYLHTSTDPACKWGFLGKGGGTLGVSSAIMLSSASSGEGGVVRLVAENAASKGIIMAAGYRSGVATYSGWWNLTNAAAMFRFRTPDSLAQCNFVMGLAKGADPSNPSAVVYHVPGGETGHLYAIVAGDAGEGTGVLIGNIAVSTWYTVWMWKKDITTMYFRLSGGNPTTEASVQDGDVIKSTQYDLYVSVVNGLTPTGVTWLDIDQASATDMAFANDM